MDRPFRFVISTALVGSLAISAAYAQTLADCGAWRAAFVSVDGDVEIRATQTSAWVPADQGMAICRGYTIRVNEFGRAAVRLPDMSMLRLSSNSLLSFRDPPGDTESLLDLLRGLIHIISRDPRALEFTTPYANAGLEGTEFVIAVSDKGTEVSVIEGEVRVSNQSGTVSVPEGQRALANPGQPPRTERVADRFAETRWAPYYPPIFYLNLPSPDSSIPNQAYDPVYLTARAAGRLAVGAVTDAQADVRRALVAAPRDASALALASLLALNRGDKQGALENATTAVDYDPQSVPAWIALSHVQQAAFQYAAALASLEHATDLDPENAIALAWLAELRLSNRDVRGALAAANRAEELDAGATHVQTVLGFVYLEYASAERAAAAFQRATQLDQADPLPRIGLALALLRQDKFIEGREQAETAVILGANNAQIRSYMAKIYLQENRLGLTESQLQIAQELDPTDATPHYYEAVSRQIDNSPILALRSLNKAVALNRNRAPFRSSLRVDEDLAVRGYGIGTVYRDLGFVQLALLAGAKATLDTPQDPSGHGLLADLYTNRPRHEIARVNEWDKARLLQPLATTPFPAQLAEANLFILDDVGPSELASTGYGPLMRRDGLSFLTSAVSGGNDTEGVSVSMAGTRDTVSFGASHFDFSTDGLRENNDLDQQITNAFVQLRPTYRTGVQAELRSTTSKRGDLRMLFEPTAYTPELRQEERVDSLRVGVKHELSPRSTLLSMLIAERSDIDATTGPAFSKSEARSGTILDIQHLLRRNRWHLTSGLRHLEQRADSSTSFVAPEPFPPFELASTTVTANESLIHTSAYAYADVSLNERWTATVGMAADSVKSSVTDSEQLSPKLGLMFEPNSDTTIRATAFRTLEGPLVSKHNIQPRLEPTHVVGFNQFYFGSEGEETTRLGLAIDRKISAIVFAGAELSARSAQSTFQDPQLGPGGLQRIERDESLLTGYLYWTPTTHLAVAVEYQYENVDGNGKVLDDQVTNLKTHRIPVSLNIFNGIGLHARAEATYVDQEGNFSPVATFPEPTIVPGSDSFWVLDLSLSYRLPRRRGSISLSIDNALDQTFRFQDTDPENQSIMPERMLALRFTLSY